LNSTVTINADTDTAIAVSTGPGANGPFKAVKLRKTGRGFELVWKKTSAGPAATNVQSFMRELTALSEPQYDSEPNATVAVIADSSGFVFHRIYIPPVADHQVQDIVKIQAEALLPLPADKMQLTWRADNVAENKRPVTIVAGKTDGLRRVARAARTLRASKILLDYEAVATTWSRLFGGTNQKSVIMNISEVGTCVLLAENGTLKHAVTLDVRPEDLSARENRPAAAELLAHDLRNILQLFGFDAAPDTEVLILSEKPGTHKRLISYLADAGINTRPVVPNLESLKAPENTTPSDIIEYIEPVGAAMLALETDGSELNLFENLYTPAELAKAKQTAALLKRPCIVTAAMVALFLLVSYAVDKAGLAQLKKQMYSATGNPSVVNAGVLIEQQSMRKTIAQHRPDMLDLLTKINQSEPEGMILDTFMFKKGQAVTITGSCKSYDQLYEFQKKLGDQSGIREVKIQNSAFDKKKGKVGFKMAFHYKNFTKKK
jgi:hypothetical protein